MATNVAKIQAVLDLNTGQFHGSIQAAQGALRTFNTNINNAGRGVQALGHKVHGLGATLTGTMVVLGQFRAAMHTLWMFTGQWVSAIIDANAKLERLQVLMKGLSRSSTEAGKVAESLENMSYVLDKARNAPFSIDEIANSFVKLKAAGIDPTKGALDALMNAVAAFGGDDQTFHRATVAIQQMAGKGVISMEELRQQLGEAIPNAMQLLARAANMSMGDLIKQISLGRVAAGDALNRLMREFQLEFAGKAEAMMHTWTGMVSRLKTEWLVFAKEIGNAGLFAGAKDALGDLTKFMASGEGKQFARDLGKSLGEAARAAANLLQWIIKNREELISWGRLLAEIFVVYKIGQFATAFMTMAANVVGAIGSMTSYWARYTAAVAAAQGGTATMSTALAGLGGPIGIAIAAIAALTLAWWENERSIRAAGAAIDDYIKANKRKQLADDESNEDMRERIRLAEQDLALLEKIGKNPAGQFTDRISGAKLNAATMRSMLAGRLMESGFLESSSLSDATLGLDEIVERDVKAARKKLDELRNATIESVGRTAESDFDASLARFESTLNRRTGNISATLNARLGKIWDEKGTKQAEARGNAIKEAFNAEIQWAMGEEAILQRKYDQAPAAAKQNFARLLEVASDYRRRLVQQRDGLLGDMNKPLELFAGSGGGAGGKTKADPLMDYYQMVVGKIAALKASAEDASPTLAKFNATLGAGPGNEGLKASIRALIVEMDALNEAAKRNKATDKLTQDLTDLEAKAKSDRIVAEMRTSNDLYAQISTGMVSFNRQIEVMRANLDQTSMSREAFEKWVAKIREHLSAIDLVNFQDWAENTEWENYLATLPEREANLARFNKRLRELILLRQKLKEQSPGDAAAIDEAMDRVEQSERNRFEHENRSSLQQWIDQWRDTTEEMDALWAGSMDRMADTLTQFVMTGKANFKDLARFILAEIVKILISKALAKLVEVLTSMWGSSGGGGAAMEDGGIMTDEGEVPLKTYSKGGIANSPQLTLFGEGRTPEAFVPLPDGRNIPVKMEGGGGVQNDVSITVVIQGDSQDSSEKANADKDGRALAKTLEGKVRETMAQELRPGGILWKMRNGG